MSYFEKIEIPKEEEEKKEEKKFPTKWQAYIKVVQEEITKAQNGTSDLVSYPVYFTQGKGAMLASFDRFKKSQTEERLKEFLTLTKQDLGLKAARTFNQLAVKIYKDVEGFVDEE